MKGVIEYSNVCFSYPKSKSMVLDDISFKIKQGETIAIVGATGCGKSTLVNLHVWESAPMIQSPGPTRPFSGSSACSMPTQPTS